MRLGLHELLIGGATALTATPEEASSGDFSAGTRGVVALLCVLAAQEAECGAARRLAQNRRMRALFAAALGDGAAGPLHARLAALAAGDDDDLTLSRLDEAGAALRDALIALHIHAEQEGLRNSELRILRLLCDHAEANRLHLPIQEAG